MTKQEAKELTLEVWRWLMWRPWVDNLNIIQRKFPDYPILEGCYIIVIFPTCITSKCKYVFKKDCSLSDCCRDGYISKWLYSVTPIGRFINSARIVRRVKKWEVENKWI